MNQPWCRLLWWQNLTARVGEVFYENRSAKVSLPIVGEGGPDLPPLLEMGPLVPALILGGVTLLSLLIVRMRLRRVEVWE